MLFRSDFRHAVHDLINKDKPVDLEVMVKAAYITDDDSLDDIALGLKDELLTKVRDKIGDQSINFLTSPP